MSEMATSQAYDTIDNIARIQELLNQDIERSNDLEALLAAAKQQVEQRKQELARYQTAGTRTVARTSINDFSPEILSVVFKLSMPKEGWMQHTDCLLRVCKRWHGLIINDPYMWNHISVISPDRWDILSWAKSTRSYLEVCIKRSRASRLHIELNLTILKTAKRRLIERFHSGLFHFPYVSQAEGDDEFLEDWLDNLDYHDLECATTKDCLPYYATDILEVLTDPKVMRRWESLTIWFPRNQLAEGIWEAIAPHASDLSRLHIVGFSWEDLCESYGDGYGEASLSIPSWAIPRVEDLRMKTLISWDRFLSFDPSSIQRLAVDLAFEEEFSSQLARFSQLRTLTLSSPGIHEDIEVDFSATNRISIRTLEELVLIGEFDYLDTVMFDLPNLKRICMEPKGPVTTQPAIITAQPSEVHWAADTNIFFRGEILETADKDIRGFLLSYTSSGCFSVAAFLKENVLKVLKEVSLEGVLPPGWRTVSFHDVYGGIETMQIDNIVGSDQDVDMLTCS